MSTETATPPASTSPARPAAPVNPTSQKRPTPPMAPPTTSRPTAADAPDFSKARPNPDVVPAAIKEGISKVWNSNKPPTADVITPPATTTTHANEPTKATEKPAETTSPKAEVKTEPAATEPVKTTVEPTDPFAGIAEPEGISEAGKKGWKALKEKAATEIAATQKKLADAEAQLSTLRKATPAETADIERLKADHQKALDRLAVLDLQSHPDFTRQYVEPKAKALAEANEVLSYNGKEAIDPAILFSKSQKEFNAAVAEATKDMNAMDAMAVQTSLRSAYKLTGDEKAALAKAGELRAGIEAKNAMQTKQAFEEVYGKLGMENLITPKQAPEGATAEQKAMVDQYNQAVSQARSMAEKNAFGRLSPKEAAEVATKAAYLDIIVNHAMPAVEQGYNAVVAENKRLAQELASIKGLKRPGEFTAPAETDTGEKKDAKYYLKKAFGNR